MKKNTACLRFLLSILGGLLIFCQQLNAQINFHPSDIPGLKLWLTADSVHLTGGKVDTCFNLSILDSNAIQSNTSFQPTQLLNTLNGHAALRFDGNDLFKITNFPYGINNTVFVVGRRNGGGSDGTFLGGDFYNLDIRVDLSQIQIGGVTLGSYTSDVFRFFSLLRVSGDSRIYLNGNLNGTNSSVVSNIGTGNIYIGNRNDLGTPLTGDIAEILVYNDSLSDSARYQVENYIRYKYSPPVNLGPDTTVCSFPVILKAKKDHFISYQWQNLATQDSLIVSSPGTYYVTVQDIFGFSSSDTIQVMINLPAPFQLNDTVMCDGPVIWNTGLSNSSYTFQWQDNTTDSLFSITQSGQYYVTVTNSIGCITTTDTANVIIDKFSSSASLGNDVSLCSGNSIYLQTGASSAVDYLWSDSTINDSLQINDPGQYWVTVTNINSCVAKDTINVNISGHAPIAEFAFSNICFGNTTMFNDSSSAYPGDTLTSRTWDFGDSFTSTSVNPSHTYADTGSYTVRLTVTTNAGCSGAINKIVHIVPLPVAIFSSPTNQCEDTRVSFTGNATAFGYPITQWSWNFGDPISGINDTSSVQNPGHYYSSNGVYPVTLIVLNNLGCADTAINTIAIKPAPVASFTSSFACSLAPVQFTDNSFFPSGILNTSFWNFGDAATSSLLNPSHTYLSGSTFNVVHVVTASNGCKDTVIVPVTINPKPDANFSAPDKCAGVPVPFTDASTISVGSIAGWSWKFGTTGNSILQNPEFSFGSSGNYNVQLIVSSNVGCKDTVSKSVTIYPQPVSNFTLSSTYGSPPLVVNFTNTSSGAASYIWDFDDGSLTSTVVSPSHTYADTGNYEISLIAFNSFGCTDTASHSLDVTPLKMDVEVVDFSAVIQNNFLNVTAQFKNNGSADVHLMDVYFKINNGAWIKENWGGSLIRQGSVYYTFTTSAFINDDKHYVCVSAQKPNGLDDEFPSDNELCKTIDAGSFQVFPSFPDPVQDILTLPVFIPGSNNLNITVYNGMGKKVEEVFSGQLDEGFYSIPFNTLKLTSGLYLFRITYKEETVVQKFIKK
jgi:PKD repeat protein